MNKGIRLAGLLLSLAVILLFSTGCLEQRSPDEYGYAMIIGVDKGKEKPFYVSMLLQRGNEQTENVQSKQASLVGVECEDMFEAVRLLESGLPFALTLSRTSAIVFSEEVAAGGSMDKLLSVSLGTLFVRYYANLIVARGRADAYLEGLQSELTSNIAKMQYSFVEYSEQTGYIPSITLAQFYDRAWNGAGDVLLPLGAKEKSEAASEEQEKEPFNLLLPKGNFGLSALDGSNIYPREYAKEEPVIFLEDMLGSTALLPGESQRKGGLDAGMMGSAVFRGTEMVGILNGTHTQAVMIATGQLKHGRMYIPLPDGEQVSVLLTQTDRPRVSLSLGEQPYADVCVFLHAAIEQPDLAAKWPQETMQGYISTYIEGLMQEVFLACKANKADVFAFGKLAVMQFTDTRQWEVFDWPYHYAKLQAGFTAEVQLAYNPTGSRLE